MTRTLDGRAAAAAGPVRRHALAGLLAAVVSVGVHVLLLTSDSGIAFRGAVLPVEARRATRQRYLELLDPPPALAAARTRPAVVPPGDGGLMTDLGVAVAALARRPDSALTEPPPVLSERLVAEASSLATPAAPAVRDTWEPRQEVLVVEKHVAEDVVAPTPRRTIPDVVRVAQAADIALPVDRLKSTLNPTVAVESRRLPVDAPLPAVPEGRPSAAGAVGAGDAPLRLEEFRVAQRAAALLAEPAAKITVFKPIEQYLRAEIETYTRLTDLRHGYFRVRVWRAGADVLPVLPKDIVFVQDCSASMTEQRLHFCRQALHRCLAELGPVDRFNVVRFANRLEKAFPAWAEPTKENLAAAGAFVEGMTAAGNTDIFSSLQSLLAMERTPGRPCLALLISDGRSTVGVTDSTEIIGEFSRANDGALSMFSVGTAEGADMYLLDLLSYCNRGDTLDAGGDRWGIADAVAGLARGVARPVLADVQFRFAGAEGLEVFPVQTTGLYLDRPLVLYGRYPRGARQVVLHAAGRAGDARCDMVFDLSLAQAAAGDAAIRTAWAAQKIYHLLGRYARRPDADLLREIKDTAREYRVRVPYQDAL